MAVKPRQADWKVEDHIGPNISALNNEKQKFFKCSIILHLLAIKWTLTIEGAEQPKKSEIILSRVADSIKHETSLSWTIANGANSQV